MTYDEAKDIIEEKIDMACGQWRHVKTRKKVTVAALCIIEATMTPAAFYIESDSWIPWIRPLTEFLDGRFVKVEKTMPTKRKIREYWTEVKRVVDGEVKVTVCCCAAPGSTVKGCAIVAGNKTRCRCDCHRRK